MTAFPLESYLASRRARTDRALSRLFRAERRRVPARLLAAMRYSLFAGGKRLRPVLALASAEVVGLPERSALRVACALEMVHTYSLIHDDLPALDNDDFRRGRPTSHRVFGEALAVLAGDALLTLAFAHLADPSGHPRAVRQNLAAAVRELADQAGPRGMVGGQVDDVLAEGCRPIRRRVVSIHSRKTGALFSACLRIPAILKGAPPRVLRALSAYGRAAGLAFQIVDDLLNETGTRRVLGKAAGSDRVRGKMTYPAAVGVETSRREVEYLTRRALRALLPLGRRARPLAALAVHMAERSR